MKHTWLILLAGLAIGSCKNDDPFKFSLSTEGSVMLPANYGVYVETTINSEIVATGAAEKFETESTNASLIETIAPSRLLCTITEPDGVDFGSLAKIQVFINAEGVNELALTEVLEVDADAGSSVQLELANGLELVEYLRQENIWFRVLFTPDAFTNVGTTMELSLQTSVTALPED